MLAGSNCARSNPVRDTLIPEPADLHPHPFDGHAAVQQHMGRDSLSLNQQRGKHVVCSDERLMLEPGVVEGHLDDAFDTRGGNHLFLRGPLASGHNLLDLGPGGGQIQARTPQHLATQTIRLSDQTEEKMLGPDVCQTASFGL